jgi:hypothetical protein
MGKHSWEDLDLRLDPGKNARSYLKNNQSKKVAGGLGQVVECLSSKYKAQSSNPL